MLLILAGISISMLTGDNSIIKNAKQAKYATTAAEIKDIVALELNDIEGEEVSERKTYTTDEKRQSIMDALSEAGFDEEQAGKK